MGAIDIAIVASLAKALAAASTAAPTSQTFNASGTWTKPAGAQVVLVKMWGAGGGGSSGYPSSFSQRHACGGGGGGYNEAWFYADELPASVSVTVGAGGAGAAATQGAVGGKGGDSSFGTIMWAQGGFAGYPGTSSGYMGGAGGFSLPSLNDGNWDGRIPPTGVLPFYSGGNGTTGGYYANISGPHRVLNGGGGGGGSADGSSPTTAPTTSINGGSGGAASEGANANGGTGVVPGGGGGSAYNILGTGTGGVGGAGRVIVTTYYQRNALQ